jgi:serine/threonine protein kinase
MQMQVAVKCIDNSVLLVDAVNAELMKTVAILQCLDHDSLLRLYGAVVTPASTMLVMELAPLRSLAECLRDTLLQRSFTAARLHVFTLQVCSAMAFLESKHIVHGDLALKNVMVVSKTKVKVGDSCLSRILSPAAQTVSKSFYMQSCAWYICSLRVFTAQC